MVQPAGDGIPLLWAAALLLSFCWLAYVLRAGVRVWKKAFGSDDWAMLVGLVRVLAFCCVVMY